MLFKYTFLLLYLGELNTIFIRVNFRHITHFFCALGVLLLLSPTITARQEAKLDRIWKVKIEGNTTFEDIVIKKFIVTESPSFWKKLTFFNEKGYYVSESELQRDVIRIQRFYQRRGFYDAKVSYRLEESETYWKKILTFDIVENAPTIINTVNIQLSASKKDSLLITSDDRFNSALRRIPYRKGRRYESIEATETEGNVSLTLRNLGFAYATTKVEASVDSSLGTADINLKLATGPQTRFDSVLVEGETTLPERFIHRETGIRKGELYTEKTMREAQREIFNHHLFRFAIVSLPEQPQDTSLNVLVRIKEMPLRSVQLKFGIGNFDRIEGPIGTNNFYRIFRGQATWVYRNVRQKGERFSTSLGVSGYDQRFGFDYLFPYLFNTKSSVVSAPFIQHKIESSYEIVRGGITNNFIYQYNQNLTGTIGYEFTTNYEVARKTKTTLPDSVLNYNISSINLNAYYSKGLKGEREGWVVQPYLELSGLFNEATYSFQKLSLDVRKYTAINQKLVLAARVSGGAIFSASQDSLPQDIRFFTGGTSSVRGWNRQGMGPKEVITDSLGAFERYVPAGGKSFLNFNVELRQNLDRFIKGFGIAAFFDGGQVWKNLSSASTSSVQFGTGGGLRYQSPIGPIRIDLAYKINPTDEDLNIYNGVDYGNKWSRWGIHLSIGQAF